MVAEGGREKSTRYKVLVQADGREEAKVKMTPPFPG